MRGIAHYKKRSMHFSQITRTVTALTLAACSAAEQPLNSERIESEFGSYGLEILSYENGLRRASLYSVHGSNKITRTYAIVHFDDVPKEIAGNEHAHILEGASIGATFKAAGWTISKGTLYIGTVSPGDDVHAIAALMNLDEASGLAMHVYKLGLRKDSQHIDYATIIEVHHPDYMNPDRLQRLYGDSNKSKPDVQLLDHWRSLVLTAAHDTHGHD